MKDKNRLRLKWIQKVETFEYDNRLVAIAIRPMKSLRGSLKGIDTTIERDEDRL